MASKQKSGGGARKIGRNKRKPSNQRYHARYLAYGTGNKREADRLAYRRSLYAY